MRVGFGWIGVLAVLGGVSAAPHRHDRRGGCICTKTAKAGAQATGTSSSDGNAVVYADSGSSAGSGADDTSDSTWDSSTSSWDEESSESLGSGSYAGSAYHSVIYYSYVPVPVPCTTTCLTTGNIIIENDITINISIAPTVITYTTTSTSTATVTSVEPWASGRPSGAPSAALGAGGRLAGAPSNSYPSGAPSGPPSSGQSANQHGGPPSSGRNGTNSYPSSAPSTPAPSSAPPSPASSSAPAPYPADNEPQPSAKTAWDGHYVIGYYGSGESVFMGVDDVPWPDLTHICFAFGNIATDGTYAVNITDTALMSQLFTAAANNGVNAILSIGGWGYGSAEYSSMVATSESRSQFINSLLDLATEYNIKGVDLDWEYPGRPSDESVPYNATGDIPNYTLLLQEIAAAFGGNDFTISAAVAAMTPFSDDISDMVEYFDWLGLMFYDFATGTVDETMSDSPLTGDVSAEAGVAAWYAAGLPYDKMVFGIPAYGRSFTLANFSDYDIGAPVLSTKPQGDSDQSAGTGVWKFRNMVSQGVLVANSTLGEGMYSAGGDWELEWDEDSQTPFVWNTVTGEWITYDDPTSISIKRNYCASMGMLGMMVWEVEYDTDAGILMSYMN